LHNISLGIEHRFLKIKCFHFLKRIENPELNYLAHEILRDVAVLERKGRLIDAAVGKGESEAAFNGWLAISPV
jgi:hypothetical protein